VEQKKHIAMRIFRVQILLALVVCAFVIPAHAIDYLERKQSTNPFDVFKLGFKSYQNGNKEEALEAYQYAAEKGHAGAQWKLARMYDEGDGVPQDNYKAFKIYEKIVDQGIDPISPESSFVSNSLLRLARFFKTGIKDSPVSIDLSAARDLYAQAAWSFRDPDAQFELGMMFLRGEGGIKDKKQAFHLLKLSSQKGHPSALAMFGDMLFQNGKKVRGLANLTTAMKLSDIKNYGWIADMQEKAFSVTNEIERRASMDLSQTMAHGGQKSDLSVPISEPFNFISRWVKNAQ
jgi:uncharacterized protein